jgi:undecaprenyl-phosphate 4-deoxy-4-formamido-L-arabinose transferase
MEKKIKISFVIPCYKSEHTIKPVTDEIINIVSMKKEYDYEIICVNDKSPDNVWDVLKELAGNNKKIKAINLCKNRNKTGAEMAGLGASTGDIVILMDDDGQCPMDRLWDLIKPLEDGHDVSMAKYNKYKQSKFKDFGTVFNRKMTEYVIDKPKDVYFTNFMAFRRYIVDEVIKYKNPYPYIEGLLLRTTSDFVNVPMEERNRKEGKSTFTFKKLVSMWFNGFTAFSIKPLRVSTLIGAITAFVGFIYGLYIIIVKLVDPSNVPVGYSSIIAIMLFVSGLIMLMLGMIGEYIGRIYISINNSPQYVIKEELNIGDNDDEKEKKKK